MIWIALYETTEKAFCINKHKIESVNILREWVIQGTKFQTKAIETIQGLSRKHDTRRESQIRILV